MKQDEIKAGALLSYLNLLIGNLIPFIYTPIMLRMLGQAEYGIYGIAQSVMGYIGLLNFGIGGLFVQVSCRGRFGRREARLRPVHQDLFCDRCSDSVGRHILLFPSGRVWTLSNSR